jgi:hypothetical protein
MLNLTKERPNSPASHTVYVWANMWMGRDDLLTKIRLLHSLKRSCRTLKRVHVVRPAVCSHIACKPHARQTCVLSAVGGATKHVLLPSISVYGFRSDAHEGTLCVAVACRTAERHESAQDRATTYSSCPRPLC